jgi:hypothetical protein
MALTFAWHQTRTDDVHGNELWTMKRNNNNRKSWNSRSKSRSQTGRKGSNSRRPRSWAASRALGQAWLKDFLSEMHAVEQGGVQLYEKALEELQHEMYQTQLEKFLDQTRRHVELCVEMMEAAGTNESHGSPGAEAAEHKAQGLISTEVPEESWPISTTARTWYLLKLKTIGIGKL